MAQTAGSRLDILVIDNASTDGTHASLEGLIASGEIKYVNTGANLGGAGGFSYGIGKAVELGYQYVWVMDDDCMPEPSALEGFLECDRSLNGEYGFLSSQVRWRDGSLCAMNVQRTTLSKRVSDFESSRVPIILASFVSLFVPTRVVKRFGLPIAEFFVWTDDWEFTRRISRELPCYLVNGSVVIHKSARNIGASVADEDASRLGRFRTMFRNDVVLYRGEGLRGFCYEVARITVHTLRVLLRARDHRMERLAAIYGGTIDGLRFFPEIEYIGSGS